LRILFFDTAVLMLFAGETFILLVTSVFTRIHSWVVGGENYSGGTKVDLILVAAVVAVVESGALQI
jgi:hypothetical protein